MKGKEIYDCFFFRCLMEVTCILIIPCCIIYGVVFCMFDANTSDLVKIPLSVILGIIFPHVWIGLYVLVRGCVLNAYSRGGREEIGEIGEKEEDKEEENIQSAV